MASRDLTFPEKAEILRQHQSVVLEKIMITPVFMTHLVEAGVISEHDSQDIQDHKTTTEKRNALLKHLTACSPAQFSSFCEVLNDKANRPDIVKDFGLDIESIRNKTNNTRTVADTNQVVAPHASEMAVPLWDPKHPDGKALLRKRQDLISNLNRALPEVREMDTDGLWATLPKYGVMDGTTLDKCRAGEITADQIERIVKFLKQDQVWKFHAFLKTLHDIGKTAYIDVILGDGASSAYTD